MTSRQFFEHLIPTNLIWRKKLELRLGKPDFFNKLKIIIMEHSLLKTNRKKQFFIRICYVTHFCGILQALGFVFQRSQRVHNRGRVLFSTYPTRLFRHLEMTLWIENVSHSNLRPAYCLNYLLVRLVLWGLKTVTKLLDIPLLKTNVHSELIGQFCLTN